MPVRLRSAHASPRSLSRAAVLLEVALAAGMGRSVAAEWRFDPVVSLAFENTDNVALVAGPAGAPGREAADLLSVELLLPLAARGPKDELELSYRPIRERYRGLASIPASSLDNTAHYVAFGWTREASPRTRWELRTGWSRADRARLAFDAPQADFVALPRTSIETVSASLRLRRRTSPLGQLEAGLSYHTTGFGDPSLGAPGVGTLTVTDSRSFGIDGAYEFAAGHATQLRFGYRGDRISEGTRGEVDVHRVFFGWRAGSADRRSLDVVLGVTRTNVIRTAPGLNDRTGFVGTVTAKTRLARSGRFEVGVTRDVGGSGGTSGPVESTSAHAGLSVPTGRWSAVSFAAHWADRSPLGDDLSTAPPTRTRVVRGEWAAAVHRTVALVLSAEQVRQVTDAQAVPLAVDYRLLGLGVRWTPTAEQR